MVPTESPTDVRLALTPAPEAPMRARRALADAGPEGDIDPTVALLVSEVVTNAVRHAGLEAEQRIVLLASLESDYAHVEVYDAGEGFDPEVRHSVDGFGLRLLDKLATRWGSERGRGCAVWFDVDRRPRRRLDRVAPA